MLKFLIAILYSLSFIVSAEETPDFDSMENVEPSGRVKTDGKNYYLIYLAQPKQLYVQVPEPIDGYSYVSFQCNYNKIYDHMTIYVTALVVIEDKANWTKVKAAWSLDDEKTEIVELDPTNVTCFNEGWGV